MPTCKEKNNQSKSLEFRPDPLKMKTRVKSSLSPLILVLLFLIMPKQVFAQDYNNEANFTQIYSANYNGDIAATGSPVLCAKKNGKCDWNYNGYLYDIDPLTLHDGNTTAFPLNSGGAVLKLPNGISGADILWAKVYWQGHIFGLEDKLKFKDAIIGLESVKMLDSKGIEHTLTAKKSDIYYYGYDKKAVFDNKSKGYRYFYQASADVTSIVQNSYSSTNKHFIIGNINTTMTKDTYYIVDAKLNAFVKWGNWGGWSLVVAYKDPNASLKNINLFDGFKFLLPPFGTTASLTINLPANSFYTPKFGVVKSKVIMFSAGAEKKISADNLEMFSNKNGGGYKSLFNTLNPANNQMNDSITYLNQDINATRKFNAGIDLDTYDSSNILDNGQTTTSIKVTMSASAQSADQAFVGFIGISNDIYQPKICYIETLYDSNNIKIKNGSKINIGSIIQNRLTIKNDGNETANNVKIIHFFDNNKTIYETNSTVVNNIDAAGNLIGDVNQTDAYNDDLGDYNLTSNKSIIRLGRGATGSKGGSFQPNDTTFAIFNSKMNTDQNISFDYKTSYIFNIAGQDFTFDGPLPKCTDFNNIIQGNSPAGSFNVVHSSFSSITDPIDGSDPKNALYTQISNQSFQVKILHVDASNTVLSNYNGDINVSIIDTPNYIIGDTAQNQILCQNAISGTTNGFTTVNFSNSSSKNKNFTYSNANKNLSFGITYTDGTTTKYVCSRDKFAVRPDKFNLTISGALTHKAGKNFNISFQAPDINNALTLNYNESVGNSFKIDINDTKTGCKTGDFNTSLKTGWSFVNGNYTFLNNNYNEVSVLEVKIQEINGNEFAKVDNSDTSDTLRLITPYDKNITFTPDHFNINAVLKNAGNSFTYLSSDLNMSSTLDMNITAKTENNATTTNYNSLCYAQRTDYNISYANLPNNLPNILYRETNSSIDGNQTINLDINLTIPNTVFSTDNNGTASLHVKINFDRNQSVAVNPFVLNIQDINVTDTNNTIGNKNIDKNTTFYYGRVHAKDQRFDTNPGTVTIYYEVYSDQNKSTRNSLDINGSESVDSINWYVNTLHFSSDGNVTYKPINGVTLNRNTSVNTASGIDTITITALKIPHKDKIEFNPSSSWLIYNPTDFMVEFYGKGGWAGSGKLGKTVDLNVSTKQNKRINW